MIPKKRGGNSLFQWSGIRTFKKKPPQRVRGTTTTKHKQPERNDEDVSANANNPQQRYKVVHARLQPANKWQTTPEILSSVIDAYLRIMKDKHPQSAFTPEQFMLVCTGETRLEWAHLKINKWLVPIRIRKGTHRG